MVFALLSGSLISTTANAQDRPIVAVFDVDAQGVDLPAPTWERLNNYLCSLLAEKGYQVVPRAKLKESLQEKKQESYQQCYDQACQIEIGQELAAQKSLSTQILALGGKCKLTLTLYDLKRSTSEKGTTVSGGCVEAQIVESLEKAMEQLVGAGSAKAVEPTTKQLAISEKPALQWIHSGRARVDFTKSEVTIAQYRACVEAKKCVAPNTQRDDRICNWGQPDRDDHPVNCVDWTQSNDFCRWVGGRLPTKEEWVLESSDAGNRHYAWGSVPASCENTVMVQGGKGCGRLSTWPVCSKPNGNSLSGLCDMSGNVFEWTSTEEGGEYYFCGGSWYVDKQEDYMARFCLDADPTLWDVDSGIRCARQSK